MKYPLKRYICILSVVLYSIAALAYDEVSHGSYPVKLPQSPNVAEFPQYGDVPVNHYTGTMTLNIPIYEIDVDGCKVPISLTYSATGIKVAQHASNVGLGWQLNCGGIITADCYGKNDFDYDGFLGNRYNHGIPDDSELYKYNFSNWGVDISTTDTRPDIFHYSFCGNTGTMVFKPRNGRTPVQINQDKYLDITYSHDAQTWVIYDGNGNKYHFGNKYHLALNTVLAGVPTLSTESAIGVEDDPNKGGCSWEYKSINAWPLDTIITSHGRRIIFHYKRESIATPMIGQEEIRLAPIDGCHTYEYSDECNGCNVCDIPWRSNYFSHISSTVIQSVVSDILFPGGIIRFYSSARKDVWAGMYSPPNITDVDGGTKIDSIVVTGHSGRVIKRAVMHYHYAGNTSSPNTCRLMLDSVTGLEERPYIFSYHNETLPKKNSRQIDMWGYYNASKAQSIWSPIWSATKKEEGTLMPSMMIDGEIYFGRDRQCNPQTILNGTLQKVVYPTGGYSVFAYEPHQISPVGTDAEIIKEEKVEKNTSLILNVNYLTSPSTISQSTPAEKCIVTLEPRDQINIHIEIYSLWGGPTDYSMPTMALAKIYSTSGDVVYSQAIQLHKDKMQYDFQPQLAQGTYTISLEYSHNTAANLPKPKENVYSGYIYVSENVVHLKKNNGGHVITEGGGIRVKSITNYDCTGDIIQQKQYDYTPGCMMIFPQFKNQFKEEFLCKEEPKWKPRCYPIECTIASSSMFVAPQPMINPIMVGYSRVTENTMPESEYGRIEYGFSQTVALFNLKAYPNYAAVGHIFNGELFEKCIYDGSNQIRQKEEYSYTHLNIDTVNGLHTTKLFPERYYLRGNQMVGNIDYQKYSIIAQRTTDMTCCQTDYVDGGAITKTIVTQYDSINHLPLIQQTYINDDTLTIRNMYAANSRSDRAVLLQDNYMYNAPLQQTEERNGKRSIVYDYLYAPYWRNVVLQQVRSTHNGTDSISSYIVKSVDGYGNPTCIETPSGVSVAYLWGCESLYPIVEVVGATYEQIKQAMGNEGFISMLQTNCDIFLPMLKTIYQELTRYVPMGDIHIRTYSPSVGILNEITTQGVVYSYEYDDYNRLKVKYMETDNGRIVMEQYDYHFREP